MCVCVCVCVCAHSLGPAAAHTSASATCLCQSSAVCGWRDQLHNQHHVRIQLSINSIPMSRHYVFPFYSLLFPNTSFCVFHPGVPALFPTLTLPCTPRPQLPSIMKVSQLQAHRLPPLAHLYRSLSMLARQGVCPCLLPSPPVQEGEGPPW